MEHVMNISYKFSQCKSSKSVKRQKRQPELRMTTKVVDGIPVHISVKKDGEYIAKVNGSTYTTTVTAKNANNLKQKIAREVGLMKHSEARVPTGKSTKLKRSDGDCIL